MHHHLHRKVGATSTKILTSFPFLQLPDTKKVPDDPSFIEDPLNLSRMERKLSMGMYIPDGGASRALTCQELALQITPKVLEFINDMRIICSTSSLHTSEETARHRLILAHALLSFFETYLRIELEKWFATLSSVSSIVDSLLTVPLVEFLCQPNSIPALHYIRDQGVTVGSDISDRKLRLAKGCPVYVRVENQSNLVSGRVLKALDKGMYEVMVDDNLQSMKLKSESLRFQSTSESEIAFDYDHWEKLLTEGKLDPCVADLSQDVVASEISTDERVDASSSGKDIRADHSNSSELSAAVPDYPAPPPHITAHSDSLKRKTKDDDPSRNKTLAGEVRRTMLELPECSAEDNPKMAQDSIETPVALLLHNLRPSVFNIDFPENSDAGAGAAPPPTTHRMVHDAAFPNITDPCGTRGSSHETSPRDGENVVDDGVPGSTRTRGGGKKSTWYYVESGDAWEEYKQRQKELRRINPAHIDEPFDLYSERFARQPHWNCPSCGKENLAIDRKCEGCGTRKKRVTYAEFSRIGEESFEAEYDEASEASGDESDEESDGDIRKVIYTLLKAFTLCTIDI